MEHMFVCPTCGERRPRSQRVPAARVRESILARMRAELPDWDGATTCRPDLHKYRMLLVRERLTAQQGAVASLDASVLERMERQQLQAQAHPTRSRAPLGARVADRVASFGGSWPFLGLFGGTMLVWVVGNALLLSSAFDPYPFILLNLVLSCLAAVQAPVIMMSQNRQGAKDRERADLDYQINLRGELEVQLLHEKVDHLIFEEWQRMLEILAVQTEMLEDLSSRQA